jgi:ABC-type transporter Mla MlaB component
MDIRVNKSEILLSGLLDEKTPLGELANALQKARNSHPEKRVHIDFSGVSRASSIGIHAFLKILKAAAIPVTYRRAPDWLVEQFGLLADFFVNGSDVESIQARLYCPEDDTSAVEFFALGKDLPIQADYSDFHLKYCKNGKTYEPDFDPQTYFLFITANIDRFQKKS